MHMNVFKKTAVFLLAAACFPVSPVYAQQSVPQDDTERVRDGGGYGTQDDELPIIFFDDPELSFSQPQYTAEVGSQLDLNSQLTVLYYDGVIRWTVENPLVASVTDGKVTALKTGKTNITALTTSGEKTSAELQVVFTDVPAAGKYYSAPVYWAVDEGITNGYKDADGYSRTFKPENTCTREAVVTFLWRMAGKPEPKNLNSPFKDIQNKNAYYYKAVLWAAEQEITKGYNDGTFKPNATCLREHVVTFLWRYAGMPAPKTARNPFNDVKASDYYYRAAIWANENGIAKGYSSGAYAGGFGPKLDCLREHVVTFLYRY